MTFRKAHLAFALILLSGASHAQSDAPAGNAATGKALFRSVGCFECHGLVGQGGYGGSGPGAPTGPALVPDLFPFEAFISQLRQPASDMIPYEETVLSDQKVADIYAYLKSLPPPADPKSIRIR